MEMGIGVHTYLDYLWSFSSWCLVFYSIGSFVFSVG